MNIPKEAIEKAFEGGYDNEVSRDYALHKGQWQFLALDPAFWQALGKSLGWRDVKKMEEDGEVDSDKLRDEWYYKSLRFFHRVITNGDTDAYWKEILK